MEWVQKSHQAVSVRALQWLIISVWVELTTSINTNQPLLPRSNFDQQTLGCIHTVNKTILLMFGDSHGSKLKRSTSSKLLTSKPWFFMIGRTWAAKARKSWRASSSEYGCGIPGAGKAVIKLICLFGRDSRSLNLWRTMSVCSRGESWEEDEGGSEDVFRRGTMSCPLIVTQI